MRKIKDRKCIHKQAENDLYNRVMATSNYNLGELNYEDKKVLKIGIK